ncbi:putative G-protein coupled receptor 158 isoform X1 [Solea senegalensis]|uniref:G-protein coupled receptor 158 isoform X1 n=1 Tax=Solea senegalensis TaxID=28829 RepID=A0AAV6T5Y5_SOLSE|nr:probable G-protein coupled receptor 158 isoform X1 [Solea senegalensis]KAG7524948.1 putative G-protein coupled receptor 158 isoform X1 [Solea senegalensis]
MAVFRLSLLLHVGFVLGSNHEHGGWEDVGAREAIYGAQTHRRQLAHLRAPHPPPPPPPPLAGETVAQKIEESLPRVVTAFLHTGDSSTLRHANCSRRYELTSLRGRSHVAPHRSMSSVLDTVLHATNFLNMILQTNRSREQSLRRDIEWYHALVRSILEGDAKIHRAVVTFHPGSSATGPSLLLLQATRAGGEIVLQDLSSVAHHYLHNRTADTEWYHEVKDRKKPSFHKRVLSQDFASVDNSLKRGESFIPDKTHVKWSAPYLECENGNFVPRWLLTLSAAFYGLRHNLAPEFRGVVRVDINLQDVDIDQCSTDGWFAGTHRCNLTTMECLPLSGHGFVLDKYKCHCRKGFYHPNRVAVNGFTRLNKKGNAADSSPNADEGSSSDCLPCQDGCAFCKDDTPCVAREDGALRLAVLSFQCLCMVIVFISMVVIYHFRRNKSIRASGLVLLEAILCGALLLYFPVGILYFQPSVFRCVLLRWVRLLGFATVYGTLTLKLYRVLKVFLSRTAQRIPYMTSWRVLRLLGIILLIVCWFLVAWTSAVCQNPDRKSALIDVGYTPDGLQFGMCLLDRWDYMMAVAEFLFLLWSVYLCYAVRTVPSAFHEPRYMAIAVHNELVLSAIFYVIRFTLAPELHPDWMLLLFFTHTHLTVTVTLGLLLIPKFLFAGTHMRDDIASEAYEDELDMGRSGSYLNSSITSAWSEHSLDPEDIRTPDEMGHLSSVNGCGVRSCDSLWEKRTNEELKKLYSQLEIYKRKKMLANNPHLQKKRSSKKGLGRSLMRRITEIPESVHRQCSREDKEAGEHGSNRNSICMLKKNPFDPQHVVKPAKDETLKNMVFSLKKSHSSYDHVRDQSEDSNSSATDKMDMTPAEGSLLDTLMGKKLVKKKSSDNVNLPSESTESVPLVCKSASAHNLTADKKPIHPRASMLQKSLSVIASAKEKTLGLTGKTQNLEDSNKKSQSKSKDTKANAEPDNDCPPKMIVSQSVESKQSAAKGSIMKQPTSGSEPTISSDPVTGKDLYDLSEVCPWEVEDLPTPSENKVQKHVSIAPKETTTVHGGSTKVSKSQQQKQKANDPSGRNSKEIQRTTAVRADICPWEDGGDSNASQVEVVSNQTSQVAKPQQPYTAVESSKKHRVDVCPWDFDEPQNTTDSSRSTDVTKQKKGTSPVDVRGRIALSDPPKTGGSLQPPTAKVDVCPWDYDSSSVSPNSERTPSPSKVSKTKEDTTKKKSAPSTRTLDREKSKDADDERSKTKAKDKSKSSEKYTSQQKVADVCPWDVGSHQDVPLVEKRKSANVGAAKGKQADVCPWDFEDMAEKKVGKQSNPYPKGGVASAAKKADVCPWDFDDSTPSKKA